MFYCVWLYLGHLHISNVIDRDSLQWLGDEIRYVCILYNPLLGAFLQGDDQKIRPVTGGTRLDRPIQPPLLVNCRVLGQYPLYQ